MKVGGVKVGIVGVTNPEAPGLVLPGNFGGVTPIDPVTAAMRAKAVLRRAGAAVVVAITHMGVRGFDGNGAAFGELVDFANKTSGFDVIFGDHTDVQYKGTIKGQLVHENRSFGVTYAKTSLTVDVETKTVTAKDVTFVSPTGAAPDDPRPDAGSAIATMLAPYRVQLSALLDGKIGTATDVFQRGGNLERRQETPSGDLVTDGMRWKYGTDIAVLTGGSLRAALPACGYAPADTTLHRSGYVTPPSTNLQPCTGFAAGAPYDLVKGDVYAILPFGNSIITRTVTGKQIWSMLENGVSRFAADGTNGQGRFVQASGLKYTFHYTNPTGCTGDDTIKTSWVCVPSRVTAVSLERRDADPEQRCDLHDGDDELHQRRWRRDVDARRRTGRVLRPGRERHARLHAVRRPGVRPGVLSAGSHHQAALIDRTESGSRGQATGLASNRARRSPPSIRDPRGPGRHRHRVPARAGGAIRRPCPPGWGTVHPRGRRPRHPR